LEKIRDILVYRTEVLRWALLQVVRVTATLLPRAVSKAVALLGGAVLALGTREGAHVAADFGVAFSVGRLRGWLMAVQWSAARLREFASQQRIILRRESPATVALRHENGATVLDWITRKRPFILALAHFTRDEALHAAINERVIPGTMKLLVARPLVSPANPQEWRISAQYQQILRSAKAYRPCGLEQVYVGDRMGVPPSVLKHLRSAGAVVCLMIDIPRAKAQPASLVRPFAGAERRIFPTGVGSLARMSGCPAVLCTPAPDAGGGVVLRWSDPVHAPARDDSAGDRAVTSKLLDCLEKEVARRPVDYIFPIGGQRRWDAQSGRWHGTDATAPESRQAAGAKHRTKSTS
jgi:lauroyl/myristoyl acyltransferase